MPQRLALLTLLVRDYDEAISFYVNTLGFELLEDSDLGHGKRWVRVRPRGTNGSAILLAKASSPDQRSQVGNQTAGRVFAFIETDDFARDYETLRSRGVKFVRPPRDEPYGAVAVFADLYGNLWDLIQPRAQSSRP